MAQTSPSEQESTKSPLTVTATRFPALGERLKRDGRLDGLDMDSRVFAFEYADRARAVAARAQLSAAAAELGNSIGKLHGSAVTVFDFKDELGSEWSVIAFSTANLEANQAAQLWSRSILQANEQLEALDANVRLQDVAN